MTLEEALTELQSADPKARVHAIRWLRVRGGTPSIEALIGALDDPDHEVRLRALVSLWEMKAVEAVPGLIKRLQVDRWPGWKPMYILALKEIGDRAAVPALIAALMDTDEEIASEACEALASVDELGAVEPLLRLLDDPRWKVRKAACEALDDLEVIDDRLRAALERLAGEEPPPSPDWAKLLQGAGAGDPRRRAGEWFARSARNQQLLTGKTEAEQIHDHFRDLLERLEQRRAGHDDDEADGHEEAEESPAGLPDALALLQDSDPEKRRAAVHLLSRMEAAEAAAAVIRALDDPATRVRGSAAFYAPCDRPEAVPALVRHLMEDPSPDVRKWCARQLGHIPGEHVSEALRKALADADHDVVWRAAIALRNRGDRSSIPLLLALLEHPDRRNRLCAAEVLTDLNAADARLVTALESLTQDPEAEEYDLRAEEWNSDLDRRRQLAAEDGDPEPQRWMTMAEMVAQAHRLLAQGKQ